MLTASTKEVLKHVKGVSVVLVTTFVGLQAFLVHSQYVLYTNNNWVVYLAVSVIYLTFLEDR